MQICTWASGEWAVGFGWHDRFQIFAGPWVICFAADADEDAIPARPSVPGWWLVPALLLGIAFWSGLALWVVS